MFARRAAQLSGLASALLGWRPDEFWAATPEELATIIAVMCPADQQAATTTVLNELKEQFPDG